MLEHPLAQIKNMSFLSRHDIEKISASCVQNVYLGNDITLARMLTKYKIYLDGRDAGVVPHILMDGYWESWITKFIAQVVEPGSFCIDAGANFGYYSLLLADISGREGKTIAIEPNAYLCGLLAKTSNLNECKFGVVNKAVSNYVGETILSVPANWGGASIITKAQNPGDIFTTEKVKTDKLDHVVEAAGFPRVDFIKMDCEGAEPMIFEGMEKILAQNPQLKLVMEYSPFAYLEAEKFTNFLFDRFEVGEIDGDSVARRQYAHDIPRLLNLKDHVDLYLSPKQ